MSNKQVMTLSDKGQIFKLFEDGKTLSEIASITNYPETRIQWCIEGVRNTSSWLESINIWKEVESNNDDNDGIRIKQSDSKEHSNDRSGATKVDSVRKPKKRVSRHNTRRYTLEDRPERHDSKSSFVSRGQSDTSIVETMRHNVDYKGE